MAITPEIELKNTERLRGEAGTAPLEILDLPEQLEALREVGVGFGSESKGGVITEGFRNKIVVPETKYAGESDTKVPKGAMERARSLLEEGQVEAPRVLNELLQERKVLGAPVNLTEPGVASSTVRLTQEAVKAHQAGERSRA